MQRMKTYEVEYKTKTARMAEGMAKRETRLIFAMIATVSIGMTIFSFVTA